MTHTKEKSIHVSITIYEIHARISLNHSTYFNKRLKVLMQCNNVSAHYSGMYNHPQRGVEDSTTMMYITDNNIVMSISDSITMMSISDNIATQ